MKERTRNISVGITALIGLAGIAAMLVLFGSLPSMLEKGYVIKIQFDNAAGLSSGSRVRLNGIDVGRVSDVELQYPPKQGVLVTAKINEDIKLPVGTEAHVQAPLLGGSPALELDISKLRGQMSTLPTDGSVVLQGQAVGSFAAQLQGPLKEFADRFDRLNNNFEKLADQWTKVGQNIYQLTRQVSPAEVDAGKAAGNLASIMARADQRLKEMKTAIEGINRWVNDAKFQADIRATVANAHELTGKLDKSADQINKTLEDSRASFDRLTKHYVAVADDLSAAIASARLAIDDARKGNGTVGKLIKDPQLYNNLADAAQRLDQSMTEFMLLLEKWKAEGIPLKF